MCPANNHFIFLTLLIVSYFRFCPLPDPEVGPSVLVCDVEQISSILVSASASSVLVLYSQATSVDRRGVSELFAECLFDFIGIGGVTLALHFSKDNETLFEYITEKILSNDVSRYEDCHCHWLL